MSASLIRQSAKRESMISMAATMPAIDRRASSTVTPGPRSALPRTNAISASILGWMNRLSDTASPSAYTVEPSTGPWSGESTPIICCMGLDVRPTLYPITVSPSSTSMAVSC